MQFWTRGNCLLPPPPPPNFGPYSYMIMILVYAYIFIGYHSLLSTHFLRCPFLLFGVRRVGA